MPSSINELPGFLGAAADAVQNKSPKESQGGNGGSGGGNGNSNPFTFWPQKDLQPINWNKQFPYQLLVVKTEAGQNGQVSYQQQQDWIFTLPIPPESLSIGMPFAINIAATQGGVVEEHNGAPFRDISISGTTGVLPLRGSATVLRTPILNGIFAGTVTSALRTAQTATKLATDLAGSSGQQNLVSDTDIRIGDVGKVSGYHQFHVLRQFLERYVELKKTADGFKFRLALACWKDDQIYLVTPRSFNLSRSSASPYEYPYNLSFRAYKRVTLDGNPPSAYSYRPPQFQSSILGDVLKATQDARRLVLSAADTIRAVGLDVDRAILEPLRQTILFCKDLLGVPQTLLDMPNQLIQDAKKSVLLYAATQDAFENFNNPNTNPNNNFSKQWNDLIANAKLVADLGQRVGAGENINPQNTLKTTFYAEAHSDPGNDPFRNPQKYFSLFENIPLGSLQMPRELNLKIRNEKNRVAQTKRIDWEKLRDQSLQFLVDFENAVGGGDAVYNDTYQKNTNNPDREPTEDDYEIIYSLNNYVDSLSQLAVAENTQTFTSGAVSYVAGLAKQAGLAFKVPNSKFLVPFPYGSTLENLALQYLGDPDRWIEIATLNGLEPPYVDEIGFDLLLLVDGHQNKVSVNNGTDLFVGQTVYLVSNTVRKSTRLIENIQKISDTHFSLTLNGEPDLDDYTVADNAVLHAWLPGTVNSQMSLYIPSPVVPEFEDFIYKAIPGIALLDQYFNVGNTDLLLTPKNDLIINEDGSSPIAVGLNAIIQDVRLKVSTPQGSLLRHPTFGLPLQIGASLAETSAQSILDAVQTMFKEDVTYTGVSAAQITLAGPVAQLQMAVGVRGVSQAIPVTLDLKRLV